MYARAVPSVENFGKDCRETGVSEGLGLHRAGQNTAVQPVQEEAPHQAGGTVGASHSLGLEPPGRGTPSEHPKLFRLTGLRTGTA